VPDYSPGIKKMSKGTLNPFDLDLIAMIESVIRSKVIVFLEEGYIRFEASAWGCSTNELTALEGAIKGRTGDRFIDFAVEDMTIVARFDSDPEQWPTQLRYDLIEPSNIPGSRYARKLKEVNAVFFTREYIDDVVRFTGGGVLTIPTELSALATYEFPTENGLLIAVREGEYIVKDKSHFIKMSKADFEIDFEPNK
jgi:hypothetical protein